MGQSVFGPPRETNQPGQINTRNRRNNDYETSNRAPVGRILPSNAADARQVADEIIRQAEEEASRINERSAQGSYAISGTGIRTENRDGTFVQAMSPDYRGRVGSTSVESKYAQERNRLQMAEKLGSIDPYSEQNGVTDAQAALEDHLDLPRGSVDAGTAYRTGQFIDVLGLPPSKALDLAKAEQQIGASEATSGQSSVQSKRDWLNRAMDSGILPEIERATELTKQQFYGDENGPDPNRPELAAYRAPLRQLSRQETATMAALSGGGRKIGVGQKNAFNREPGTYLEGNAGIPLLLGEATERVKKGRESVWDSSLNGGKGGFVLQPATIAVPRLNKDYVDAQRSLWMLANQGNPEARTTEIANAMLTGMEANPQFDRWSGEGTWADGTPKRADVKEQRAFDPRVVELGVVNPMAVIDDPSYSYRAAQPSKEETGGYELAGVPTPETRDFSVDENGRTVINGFADREDPYVQGMAYVQPNLAQAVKDIITTGRTPVKDYTVYAPDGSDVPDLQKYIMQRAGLEDSDPRARNMIVRNGEQLHVAYPTVGKDPGTGNEIGSYKLGPAVYPLGDPRNIDDDGVVTQSYRIGHPYEVTNQAFGEWGDLMNQIAGPSLGGGDWRVLVNEKLRDPRLNAVQYQMLQEALGDDVLAKASFTGDWPAQRVERNGITGLQGQPVRYPGDNPLYAVAKAIAGFAGNAPDEAAAPPLAESRNSRDYQALQSVLDPRLQSTFAAEAEIGRQAGLKPIPAAIASSTNSALNAPIAPATTGNEQRQMTADYLANLPAGVPDIIASFARPDASPTERRYLQNWMQNFGDRYQPAPAATIAVEPTITPQHSMGPNLREMLNQDYGGEVGTRGPGYDSETYGIGAQPMQPVNRPVGGLLNPNAPRQQSYEPPGDQERPEYAANRGVAPAARPMSDDMQIREAQAMRDYQAMMARIQPQGTAVEAPARPIADESSVRDAQAMRDYALMEARMQGQREGMSAGNISNISPGDVLSRFRRTGRFLY